MSNKLLKLGSLKGPKGDPGFTIIGEINAIADLDDLLSPDITNPPKINDAWILNPAYDDSLSNIEEKKGAVWVYRGENYEYQEGAIIQNGGLFEYITNLIGPKGDKGEEGINGLTIKGEVEPNRLEDMLFPYDAKINDAYVISRNAKSSENEGGMIISPEFPLGAKRGDVYVCVKEAFNETNGAGLDGLKAPVFEKKFNISWYGEYNDIHIMSTYDNYVVEGYDTDNVKVNDIIIDNGNTLNSRLGNIYKVINVIEDPSDENNEGWEIVNFEDLKTGDKVVITGYDSNVGSDSGIIGFPIFPEKANSINTHKAYGLDITETTENSGVYNISPKDEITKYTKKTLSIDDFIFNVEIPNEELQQIAFYVYKDHDNIETEKKYYLQVNGKTASTLRTNSSLNELTKSHLFELETDSTSVAYNYIKSLSTELEKTSYISLYSATTDGVLDYVDWRHYSASSSGVMANQKFKIYRIKKSIPSAIPKVIVDTVASVNISQRNLYHGGDNISVKNNTISALGYNYNVSKLSFSEGNSTAYGANSHAEGNLTTASGVNSHVEGYKTTATGKASHAEGNGVEAVGLASHAEGWHNIESTNSSTYRVKQDADDNTKYHIVYDFRGPTGSADGFYGIFYLKYGMTFWYNNRYYYITELFYDETNTDNPISFKLNQSIGKTDTNEFDIKLILGKSIGEGSHTEGCNTVAYSNYAHAEGNSTRAAGENSHTEGVETSAIGSNSHAEGLNSVAVGNVSHAEGSNTIAVGIYSHTEGIFNIADGYAAHAEGARNKTTNNYEHAQGYFNVSNAGDGIENQTISSIGIGKYTGGTDSPYSEEFAIRKNAVEVMRNGDVYIHRIGGYDGTNSVVEDGVVKAKTLQDCINENTLPKKENELIYFDEENGFISSPLMYSEGLVVDNEDDLEYCQSNAETSLSTVLTEWTAYGSSGSDNNDWGYCDSIPDDDTNPKTCTVTLVGGDSITVPPFKLNGEPQDYIFNTTNTRANTGFFTPEKYSNYDVTVCVGSFNKTIGAGHDYLGNLIAINSQDSSNLASDFYGISLHTLLLYPDGSDGIYESRPNYAENIKSSGERGTFTIISAGGSIPTGVITCAEAVSICDETGATYTEESYTIYGYVTEIETEYSGISGNISLWLADTPDGGQVLKAFRVRPSKDYDGNDADTRVAVGNYVKVIGTLVNYIDDGGNTPMVNPEGSYRMPCSTIQITSFKQTNLNNENSYKSHENNIPILSISEGLKIVPLKDYDPEIHGTKGDSKSYGIQSRVIRRDDIFTIYFSDAYTLYETDGETLVDDSNYSVDKNRSVVIDLSNYTLKYTYYEGDIVQSVTKKFENGLGTSYINPIGENTEYTADQINKIRTIFDNIKEEAHRGFESKSTANGFFRYVSGFDEKILDVRTEKNCVYKFENGNWNITGENPFDLLKTGSRLALNKKTNKLFYNDGLTVYQIADISETRRNNIQGDLYPSTPPSYSAGDNIDITDDVISVTGIPQVYEEGDNITLENTTNDEGKSVLKINGLSKNALTYNPERRSIALQYNEEGSFNEANADYSVVMGWNNKAIREAPDAEGLVLQAANSLVGGDNCNAYHSNTLTFGQGLITGEGNQTVIGQFNESCAGWGGIRFIIGGGSSNDDRKNLVVVQDGDCTRNESGSGGVMTWGPVKPGSNWLGDFGEYFEWFDGNPDSEDRIGYMVQLNGNKIELAQSFENCFGVISGTASVIAGECSLEWHGRFLKDEWGRYLKNEDGQLIENPQYDKSRSYQNRAQRSEWDVVGLIGQVLTRQDGTLKAGGFAGCKDGIATNSTNGYRVLKVINENIALLLIK